MKALFVFLFSIFFAVGSFAQTNHNNHDMSWKIVPNETVCMVTEAHFDKPQIPVKVGNKTYYGCCEGCKKTLTEDQAVRTATDPLTKKSVDKATATIASNSAGKVLYFESKGNFEKYMRQQQATH
jgi:YHS domain-containing protein